MKYLPILLKNHISNNAVVIEYLNTCKIQSRFKDTNKFDKISFFFTRIPTGLRSILVEEFKLAGIESENSSEPMDQNLQELWPFYNSSESFIFFLFKSIKVTLCCAFQVSCHSTFIKHINLKRNYNMK